MAIKLIDAETVKRWQEQDEAILVDVRESAEYEAEHIPSSISHPGGRIHANLLPNAAAKKLVIYCRSGMRGSHACRKLCTENPDREFYHLKGGINAWKQAGFAVAGTGGFFLPLDRQVQLTIGLCVFIGTILGYFLHPSWLLLAGFFGFGLTFAGVTGWCGLALLMAAMPWNRKTGCSKGACHV